MQDEFKLGDTILLDRASGAGMTIVTCCPGPAEADSLQVRRTVASSAVKVESNIGLDDLKAGGDAVCLHGPRCGVGNRKLGDAGLFTAAASKGFNPMIAAHPYNMSRALADSRPSAFHGHRQLKPFLGNPEPSLLVEWAYRLGGLLSALACLRNLAASASKGMGCR
jgi:hypothetical protein